MFMLMYSFRINPACPIDANGIKPRNNQKMNNKYAADYSKSVCLDRNLSWKSTRT